MHFGFEVQYERTAVWRHCNISPIWFSVCYNKPCKNWVAWKSFKPAKYPWSGLLISLLLFEFLFCCGCSLFGCTSCFLLLCYWCHLLLNTQCLMILFVRRGNLVFVHHIFSALADFFMLSTFRPGRQREIPWESPGPGVDGIPLTGSRRGEVEIGVGWPDTLDHRKKRKEKRGG